MIDIVVLDNNINHSYACVFKKNRTEYYANVFKAANGKIICDIYRATSVPEVMGRYVLEELLYRNDSEDNFFSPTTLARHIENYFNEEVNWIYYNYDEEE